MREQNCHHHQEKQKKDRGVDAHRDSTGARNSPYPLFQLLASYDSEIDQDPCEKCGSYEA